MKNAEFFMRKMSFSTGYFVVGQWLSFWFGCWLLKMHRIENWIGCFTSCHADAAQTTKRYVIIASGTWFIVLLAHTNGDNEWNIFTINNNTIAMRSSYIKSIIE